MRRGARGGGRSREREGARPNRFPGTRAWWGGPRPHAASSRTPRKDVPSMPVRVGINGFGRIGRNVFRAAQAADADIEWVAVNDLTDNATLAHLLRYDSILGPYPGTIELDDDGLVVDGKQIKVMEERDPEDLGWGDLGVDVVLESTGLLHEARRRRQAPRRRRQEGHHLRARDRRGHHRRARRELRPLRRATRTTSSPTRPARRTASRRSRRSSTRRSASSTAS